MNQINKTAIRRIIILMLALTMSLSLVACGGVDTAAAIESFNTASTRMDEVGEIASPNAVIIGDELMNEMVVIAEEMLVLKAELESEDITQERANEIEEITKEYIVAINDFEKKVEEILADPSIDKIQAIKDIISDITDKYNEVADLAVENGWDADELTVQELNALVTFLEEALVDGFYDEVAALDEAQVDALLLQCETLQSAIPELLERVSEQY